MTGYLITLFIHIVLAAFWIGGMFFLPLVVLPAIKNNPERKEILYKSGIKYRLYGWIALLGLLISGIGNMHYKGMSFSKTFFFENPLGKVLFYKLFVFFFMLLVLWFHDLYIGKKAIFSNRDEESLKKVARWSGRINLLLSLLVAYMGVMLSRGITDF